MASNGCNHWHNYEKEWVFLQHSRTNAHIPTKARPEDRSRVAVV